jgi:single-strand DNA-binding protein
LDKRGCPWRFSDLQVRVAETALKKGSRVYVEGQLQTRKWTDREGIERYQTEVVLTPVRGEMILWEAKKDAPENS